METLSWLTKPISKSRSNMRPTIRTRRSTRAPEDYMDGRHDCPFAGVSAQAWDRGHEAAMRYTRQLGGRH
jgi:hypothetical protein